MKFFLIVMNERNIYHNYAIKNERTIYFLYEFVLVNQTALVLVKFDCTK